MNTIAENLTITVNTLLYIIGKLGDGRFPQGIQDSVLRGSEAPCEVRFRHYGRQVHRHVLGLVPSMAYDIVKSLRYDGLMAQFHDQFSPSVLFQRNYACGLYSSCPDYEGANFSINEEKTKK